jgi:hypothetical protein
LPPDAGMAGVAVLSPGLKIASEISACMPRQLAPPASRTGRIKDTENNTTQQAPSTESGDVRAHGAAHRDKRPNGSDGAWRIMVCYRHGEWMGTLGRLTMQDEV